MFDTTRLSRRGLLATIGATATASAFAGGASARSYDTVVDLRDAGADPTGGDSIVPLLSEHADDDTLLRLPEGRYRMDGQFRLTGFTNVGIVGANATVVPDDYWGFDGIACFLLGTAADPGRDLHVSGLDFDLRAANTGVRAIQAQVADGLRVDDVDVLGRHDSGTWGPALFDVVDPAGSGRVSGFRAMDGGARSADAPGDIALGPSGVIVSQYHRGEITLEHLNVAGFPDNGLYAGNARGPVHVVGGYFANSTISNVRVGGDGSSVRWARVVVDDPVGDLNQRGIRLDSGAGVRVADCAVELATPNGAAIDVLDGVDSAVIENTDVTLGPGVCPAIEVHPGVDRAYVDYVDVTADGAGHTVVVRDDGAGGEVVVEGLTVAGDASGRGGRAAVLCERDGAEFRAVRIDQPGDDHRRAIDVRADDCLIYGGRYVAREYPIVNDGSGTRIIDSYAAVYDSTPALLTYSGDLKLVRTTLEDGYVDEGATPITAYGNTFL